MRARREILEPVVVRARRVPVKPIAVFIRCQLSGLRSVLGVCLPYATVILP